MKGKELQEAARQEGDAVSLRLLLVEDDPADAELCLRELRRARFALQSDVVQTREQFTECIGLNEYDVVLADYNLPGWTGLEVQEYLREVGKDIPVILISGALSDQAAADFTRRGILNYVLKDQLVRLPFAVRQAMQVRALPKEQKRSLKVLFVEDNSNDVEISRRALERGGFDVHVHWARTPQEMIEYLHSQQYDVIVSDYGLVNWTGLDALEIIQREQLDIPFILSTGTLGEEAAAEIIKKGASDYVLKDRLARLPVAVRLALQERSLHDEHRRLKLQLNQSQKMEAIGRLAGGIAHDFNNHLGIIIGHSDLLMDQLTANDPLRKRVGLIKEAALRAAALTRQLLAFSRRQVLELTILDLNTVIMELGKMLQPLIGEDIELVTLLDPALGKVSGDPTQIDQIIMNLAVNSRDAMPQGGRLTIETTNAELDESYARTHATVQPGPYVKLAVSDTGTGMDNETQSHMFEPFFTTKEKGKGTGLGLATVYGIVKQSRGYIWVYSEPGKGTTFKIYLPRLEAGIQAAEAERVSPSALKGEETVLVVEDEGMLRELACEFLQGGGYTMLEAGNGAEAIEISQRRQGTIHLLMTDMVMPGMSGRELADRLHGDRPNMKVLYVSGYTDDSVLRNGLLEPGTAFLQKPFTRDTLARKVREVLDRGNKT